MRRACFSRSSTTAARGSPAPRAPKWRQSSRSCAGAKPTSGPSPISSNPWCGCGRTRKGCAIGACAKRSSSVKPTARMIRRSWFGSDNDKKGSGMRVALCLVLLLACQSAAAVSDGDVDVLVVFPEIQALPQVYLVTDGELTRGLLVPFGGLMNSVNLPKRSRELGSKLNETLHRYDRYAVIFLALDTRFRQRSKAFA